MKISRILASLKKVLGLDQIENRRKLIMNTIKAEKINLENDIMLYNEKIDKTIIELSTVKSEYIEDSLDNIMSYMKSKELYEKKLKYYEKLEKYLNEEIEVEESKKEEKKK